MGQFKDYMDLDEHPFTGLKNYQCRSKQELKTPST